MRDYAHTTIFRFVRIFARLIVDLQEIGVSKRAIDNILEILSKDLIRYMKEDFA